MKVNVTGMVIRKRVLSLCSESTPICLYDMLEDIASTFSNRNNQACDWLNLTLNVSFLLRWGLWTFTVVVHETGVFSSSKSFHITLSLILLKACFKVYLHITRIPQNIIQPEGRITF